MKKKPMLETLIQYKAEVIQKMVNSKTIMGLLLNNPNIDMQSEEVQQARSLFFKDYGVNPEMVSTEKALILVEAKLNDTENADFQNLSLMITVVCNVAYMELPAAIFSEQTGNRADNITANIAFALSEETEQSYGIDELQLTECGPITVPKELSAMKMVFQSLHFADHMR